MEVLFQHLEKSELGKMFYSIKIARGANPISHLMFADDLFLFYNTNPFELGVLKDVLEK